jgi:formate dehydrogenase major subunit
MPNHANPKALKTDNELTHWCQQMDIEGSRFDARAAVPADLSHPAIAVNMDHCIQCTRCVRACRDVQVNDVIGLAFRGEHAAIVFDQGDALAQSTCVACGECVQACSGFRMPLLRCGLSAYLPREGQYHFACRRSQGTRQ